MSRIGKVKAQLFRGLVAVSLLIYLGYRSYKNASLQLQFDYNPLRDPLAITITNPTINPFYADSAIIDVSTNGTHIATAEITDPVTLPSYSSISVRPRLSFSSTAMADFLTSITGTITLVITGFIKVGPVEIPLSITKTLQQ